MGLHAVVLAGGTGTRLWPLSTPAHPKQFQPVLADRPLLNLAVDRAAEVAGPNVWVVTDAVYAPVVQRLAPKVPADQVLSEPRPRGTLGAVVLAAAAILRRDPEAVVALLPSDHLCDDQARLARAIRALSGHLGPRDVGLVATPTAVVNPALGHVRPGAVMGEEPGVRVCAVDDYVEKPGSADDLPGGPWLRNMGLVVGHGRALLASAGPEWAAAAEGVITGSPEGLERWEALGAERFEDAVLPHSEALVVAETDVEWLDVGTWPTLFEHVDASPTGNVVDGEVTVLDAGGNVVVSSGTPVTVAGVKDLLIVVTDEHVLVCDRSRSDQVSAIARQVSG
jgi:mannose-1-phosphate guanylyltransferase